MRTQDDIKQINIELNTLSIQGWVVGIEYKDGKRAFFSIDNGAEDGLKQVFEAIKKQLES